MRAIKKRKWCFLGKAIFFIQVEPAKHIFFVAGQKPGQKPIQKSFNLSLIFMNKFLIDRLERSAEMFSNRDFEKYPTRFIWKKLQFSLRSLRSPPRMFVYIWMFTHTCQTQSSTQHAFYLKVSPFFQDHPIHFFKYFLKKRARAARKMFNVSIYIICFPNYFLNAKTPKYKSRPRDTFV